MNVDARLQQLRDNEIDLQVELTDLAEEIESRQARMAVVLDQLRDTRCEIALLTPLSRRPDA